MVYGPLGRATVTAGVYPAVGGGARSGPCCLRELLRGQALQSVRVVGWRRPVWGSKEATLLGGRDGEEAGTWVEKLHERELGLWLKRTKTRPIQDRMFLAARVFA